MKDFEMMIEEARKEAFCKPKTQEIDISIDEYMTLKEIEKLYLFFLSAIESDFSLNYSGTQLNLIGNKTENLYRLFFPGKYNEIFEARRKEKKDGSLRTDTEVDG